MLAARVRHELGRQVRVVDPRLRRRQLEHAQDVAVLVDHVHARRGGSDDELRHPVTVERYHRRAVREPNAARHRERIRDHLHGGRAEIRAIFRSSKVGNIAGCLVQSGIMRRNAKARLLRDNVVVAENLTVSSLKREKDDATEVREGYECGLTLTYSDIKEGDVIETYELVEKERV